jgi:eukaryotic-like serine/threonine-protein kinase
VYFEPPVRSIGRYQVAGRLATGGMGEILLAQLRGPGGFERAVVIKRILPHLAEQEAAVKMFLDEARIAAGIRHPNVTQVQELLQEDGSLCIVMEYLEGESLSGIMRRMRSKGRVMDFSSCAHIVAELAAGLHAAHELRDADGLPGGLVHRDVSPQNTFVTYEGSVKVLDFGVAYFHDRRTRTQTGTLRGKFEYMSPEQCLAKELDRRSDVFALGVVLYELTTGHRLFRRKNQLLTLRAIVEEPVVPPSTLVPDYPVELEAVVLRALAKDPQDRYQTASKMRRDLVQVAHSLASGELPDQALAALMTELFGDRRQEKQAMLQRLRAGAAIDHLPEPEVDEDVELPTVDEPRPSVLTRQDDVDTLTQKPRDRSKRLSWSFIAWGVLALALVGLTVLLVATRSGAEAPAKPVEVTPTASVAPVAATASAEPAASSSVTLHVESIPPGATVLFDGRKEGKTPMDLEVPRGDEPASVSLQLSGYYPVTEQVVANVDQKLRLVMRPVGRAPRPPKPTATTSGFRRFD